MKVTMFKSGTVQYSSLVNGDCFAYNEKAYIKIATGALNCSDGTYAVESISASTPVIPYKNSVLTLN